MKPWWKTKHNWWVSDIKFHLWDKEEMKYILKRHPDDEIGDITREIIKKIDKKLKNIIKEYKEIYGDRPRMNNIQKEVIEDIKNGKKAY